MISKELIRKIRHIEINSNKLVEEVFSGEYKTRFKGKGMTFEDIRAYSPGDDVRNIDWNVTARHQSAYVKQFSEERELNVFLLIDVSGSNEFGRKKDMIAEISATLSYSANINNDNVGMIMFSDKIEKVVPSKSGKRHVLSIIENILTIKPTSKGTDIKKALKYFTKVEKKRSIVFLISDFMDQDYDNDLKIISKKHDLVLIRVMDPIEEKIPKGAIFTFEDLETGETMVLDNIRGKNDLVESLSIPYQNVIQVYTDEDYVRLLRLFFLKRVGV